MLVRGSELGLMIASVGNDVVVATAKRRAVVGCAIRMISLTVVKVMLTSTTATRSTALATPTSTASTSPALCVRMLVVCLWIAYSDIVQDHRAKLVLQPSALLGI
jgi:hypothetical protein